MPNTTRHSLIHIEMAPPRPNFQSPIADPNRLSGDDGHILLRAIASAGDDAGAIAKALGLSVDALGPQGADRLLDLCQAVRSLQQDLQSRDRLIDRLERLADEDPLIPVLNRRAFMRELRRIAAVAERYGTPASVMYLDVNKLKTINDVLGHDAGDAAIAHVVRVLLENVRRSDLIGRLGGDEFGVVLAGLDAQLAEAKAAHLAGAIAEMPTRFNDKPMSVSVSYGVTVIDPSQSPEANLAIADRLMYSHKRSRSADARVTGG